MKKQQGLAIEVKASDTQALSGRVRQARRSPNSPLKEMVPEDWNIYRAFLHSTGIKDCGRCRMHLLLNNILGLRRRGVYQPALQLGRVFHKAMALSMQGFSWKAAQEQLQKENKKFLLDSQKYLGEAGLMPNGKSWDDWERQAKDDFFKAVAMSAVFLQRYPPDLKRFEVVGVEQPVLFRMYGEGGGLLQPTFSARLDLVLRERKSGDIWIEDFKTTAKVPSMIARAMSRDLQVALYRVAAEARYPGKAVVGFIHAIIQKPSIKYCPKTKDSPEKGGFGHYVDRVVEWYDERGGDWSHEQVPLLRAEKRFSSVKPPPDTFILIKEACRLARASLTPENFPRVANTYTCANWFGMTPCEFSQVCQHEDLGSRRVVLENFYEQSHRDFERKDDEQ